MTEGRMSNPFFDRPILNSPYEYPRQHWELDETGQPTGNLLERRRRAEFITPIPKPKKRRGAVKQEELVFDEGNGLSTKSRSTTPRRSSTRCGAGRQLARPARDSVAGDAGDGAAAPALAASRVQRRPPVLLPDRGGRDGDLADRGRAASARRASGSSSTCEAANDDANPELDAAGAEARHRRRQDDRHGDADRLADGQRRAPARQQALHARLSHRRARPHHHGPAARAAAERPGQLLQRPRAGPAATCSSDIEQGARSSSPTTTPSSCASGSSSRTAAARCSQGRRGDELETLETEGQMLQRVMPELMGMKNILVLNDEAHHCYREKPPDAEDDEDLKGDEQEGGREEQRGGAPLDLRPRGGEPQARPRARVSTCRPRRSSCAAPATPRARCSPGR